MTTILPTRKIGVLLLNLGGPDSLDAVKPFLYNLFSDPDIFKLPGGRLSQKLFARMISSKREPEAREIYEHLGGRSPILPLTEAQAEALRSTLAKWGHELSVYVGMRYWHPFIGETVARMAEDGVDHILVLPLYPQYSHTTTGSSLNELRRQLRSQNLSRRMTLSVVEPYYEEPSFLDALAETMAAGFESGCWSCHRDQVTVLFSAHSLPRRFVLKTKDPYPQQIEATCRAVMRRSFPNNPWELAYQSKVGRMVWLGPTTDGLLHYFSATETDNLLIVPVAFVSDHSETLYEIDIQYAELAEQLGLKHVHRAPALNSRPPFIHLLAQLVQRELEKLSQPSAPTMMVL